jgi:hypothetical protein
MQHYPAEVEYDKTVLLISQPPQFGNIAGDGVIEGRRKV